MTRYRVIRYAGAWALVDWPYMRVGITARGESGKLMLEIMAWNGNNKQEVAYERSKNVSVDQDRGNSD